MGGQRIARMTRIRFVLSVLFVGSPNAERTIMFASRIKLDPDLLDRCRRQAEREGYSSVEEYVAHTLEKALRQSEEKPAEDEELLKERLKGLGYLE